MHEIRGGVGCCRAQRRHEETSTGVGSDVRGLSVNYWQMVTECAGVPVPVPVPVSLVCRPGHLVAWPPSAVERMSRHDEVTVRTLRHAKTTSPALAIQRKGCAYSPARQRPL
jgi:hypothetical protein